MHHDSLLLGVFMHIIPQIMFKPFLMYLKALNSILRVAASSGQPEIALLDTSNGCPGVTVAQGKHQQGKLRGLSVLYLLCPNKCSKI